MKNATPDPDYLIVENVTKQYGNLRAIDSMSLRVPRGEFLTLLGPSGSGKTTLLMALAGFVDPSAGRIFLQGDDITKKPPEMRDLGVVFQGYALFPHMTVAENVAFPLEIRGWEQSKITSRVVDILETVQLSAFADRKPAQLSGGQQQRVALARALVFSPPLILLDEPLSALDRQLRAQLQEELKQLHRKLGVSIVNVTHDQDEALSMSTLIAVINRGKIVQIDTPANIYERPRTEFVANFVGRSNLIEGTIVSASGNTVRTRIGDSEFSCRSFGTPPTLGQPVPLSIRPERIQVSKAGKGGQLQGQLADLSYHGNTTQLLIATPAGQIRVERTMWETCEGLEPGDVVDITWADDAALVVERD